MVTNKMKDRNETRPLKKEMKLESLYKVGSESELTSMVSKLIRLERLKRIQ